MSTVVRLPERSEVDVNDTWDLSSLFPNDEARETALAELESKIPDYEPFRGKLGEAVRVFAEQRGIGELLLEIGGMAGAKLELEPKLEETDTSWRLYALRNGDCYHAIFLNGLTLVLTLNGGFYEGVIESFEGISGVD